MTTPRSEPSAAGPKPSESLVLAQLHELTKQLAATNQLQQQMLAELRELSSTVRGFTNDGASLTAYVPDAMTIAFLSILGPTFAARLNANPEMSEVEVQKAAVVLSRQILEELAAYRSSQEGKDIAREALRFLSEQ